jgi:MYXO-CTERM domain-containing protein
MVWKALIVPGLAVLLVCGSANLSHSQTTTATTADVGADDDDSDWGWLGLLGLAGLAGLYRKREPVRTTTSSGSLNR